MFRVVPDQLKISDGWVRCGHCADVFDATLYLETWTPPAISAAGAGTAPAVGAASVVDPVPEPGPYGAAAAQRAADVAPVPSQVHAGATALPGSSVQAVDEDAAMPPANAVAEAATELDLPVAFWESDPEPAADHGTAMAKDAVPGSERGSPARSADGDGECEDEWLTVPAPLQSESADVPDVPLDVVELPFQPDAAAAPDEVQAPAFNGRVETEPDLHRPLAGAPQEPDSDFQRELQRFAADSAGVTAGPERDTARVVVAAANVDEEMAEPEPGFVRQARRKAFWHSPGMRVLLSVFALLLTLVLGLQWVLHERDALAAWQPRLAPVLHQLCSPLGCEVAPVRRIDAIVIDSSALVRRLGNFYSFDLVLKNNAPVALAVPALELSLTDTRDAVIARRVFLPAELPGAPALLPAQDSVTISLRLSLAVGETMPMAGYRALVFYP